MAKKKYYAVKIGKKTGIFETWEECSNQIQGVSGAQYKSFGTFKEAEKYLVAGENTESDNGSTVESSDQINSQIEKKISELSEGEVIAFVDGSYNSKEEKSGFGAIIIDEKGIQTPLYRAFNKNFKPDFLKLRNVAAELEGVKEAIEWAIAYSKKKITIYYDYAGIGEWADGSWKAKTEITKQYIKFLKDKKNLIEVKFVKVPAHSGIEYNEMADALAKRSLLEKGYKTYSDGSIYFTGYSGNDWKTIIECINEEKLALGNDAVEIIRVQIKEEQKKQRLEIRDSKNKVVINCYSNQNSFVQGKQSVLLQKIISLAIEMMKNEQTVIETLNHVHVLTLSKEEVETKFEQLLPDYNGKRSEKHYNNLLSAVYNTMLSGYMPDYTSLLTPIFRAYEYFLHRILNGKMELDTCDKNGNNRFSYFSKNNNGRYECNSKKTSVLSAEQQEYLDDLYNAYHGVRHPYTHWSIDDCDTAVITSIEVAKEYLLKGLTLANRYYILF